MYFIGMAQVKPKDAKAIGISTVQLRRILADKEMMRKTAFKNVAKLVDLTNVSWDEVYSFYFKQEVKSEDRKTKKVRIKKKITRAKRSGTAQAALAALRSAHRTR